VQSTLIATGLKPYLDDHNGNLIQASVAAGQFLFHNLDSLAHTDNATGRVGLYLVKSADRHRRPMQGKMFGITPPDCCFNGVLDRTFHDLHYVNFQPGKGLWESVSFLRKARAGLHHPSQNARSRLCRCGSQAWWRLRQAQLLRG
jgi:hypothetical protein